MDMDLSRKLVIGREIKLYYPEQLDLKIRETEPEKCAFSFDQKGTTAIGWIHFNIYKHNQHVMFYCSNQVSPFWTLLKWLNEIEKSVLPVMMIFDEERWQTKLYALPHQNQALCHIVAIDTQTEEIVFLAFVNRETFVNDIREALTDFIDHHYDEELWWDEDICYNDKGEQPYMDLKWLRKFINSTANTDIFYDYPLAVDDDASDPGHRKSLVAPVTP